MPNLRTLLILVLFASPIQAQEKPEKLSDAPKPQDKPSESDPLTKRAHELLDVCEQAYASQTDWYQITYEQVSRIQGAETRYRGTLTLSKDSNKFASVVEVHRSNKIFKFERGGTGVLLWRVSVPTETPAPPVSPTRVLHHVYVEAIDAGLNQIKATPEERAKVWSSLGGTSPAVRIAELKKRVKFTDVSERGDEIVLQGNSPLSEQGVGNPRLHILPTKCQVTLNKAGDRIYLQQIKWISSKLSTKAPTRLIPNFSNMGLASLYSLTELGATQLETPILTQNFDQPRSIKADEAEKLIEIPSDLKPTKNTDTGELSGTALIDMLRQLCGKADPTKPDPTKPAKPATNP
jgi:hypothetical protein